MKKAQLSLVASFLLLTSLTTVAQNTERRFEVESPDKGFSLGAQIPTGDFQIELALELRKGGSVLDTVGIDAAPRGAWTFGVYNDGRAHFNLWSGTSWSELATKNALEFGKPTKVLVRRIDGDVRIEMLDQAVTKSMPIPLSGKPIFVGDYPPDAHWGAGYNIHQGAVGVIRVLYVGVPRSERAQPEPVSGDVNWSARVVDEANAISSAERTAVAAALERFAKATGLQAGAAFLSQSDVAQGQARIKALRDAMIADGRLTRSCLLFAYSGPHIMLYASSGPAGTKMPWATVSSRWKEVSDGPLATRMIALLSLLAGGSGGPGFVDPEPMPGPKTRPDPEPEPITTGTKPGPVATGSGEVGPQGGAVASTGVRVEIPEGALSKPSTLKIETNQPTLFGEPAVAIEFDQPDVLLGAPATITYKIPEGADPKNLVAMRSITDKIWVTMPLEIDAAKGEARAQTHHFCKTTLLELGRTKAKITGAVVAGVSGTIVLVVVGVAATASSVAILQAIPFLLAGWLIGGAAYNSAYQDGLIGPFPSTHFNVLWDPKTTPADPYINAIVDSRTGHIVTFSKDTRKPSVPTIGPATGEASETLTYERNGSKVKVAMSDLRDFRIPVSMLGVLGELELARATYEGMGISCPDKTTVFVHTKVGKSNDKEKATNSGLWDGEILSINSKSINAEPPNSDDSRSASAHEYWHAVSTHNGYGELWPGAEESVAVSMESIVWASPPQTPPASLMRDYIGLHGWSTCSPVLRSGLFSPGADEDPTIRGYKQWPFIKYIFAKYGKDGLRDVLEQRMKDATLDEALKGFALAASTSDELVPDPLPLPAHPLPGALSTTGFAQRDLTGDADARSVKFGSNSLSKAPRASVRAFVVDVPAPVADTPPCPVVIRRVDFEPGAAPYPEWLYAGKTVVGAVPRPPRNDLLTAERLLVLPETWDVGPGRMPIMLVGLSSKGPGAPFSYKGGEDPNNPLLVYRLAPPMNVEVEHLPAITDQDSKSKFTWTNPLDAGNLEPAATIAAYVLYGRNDGGTPTKIAELYFDRESPREGWYKGAEGAIRIPPNAQEAVVPLARSKAISFDEFGMASVDGLVRQNGRPLVSAIGWLQKADLFAALAKCDFMTFRAGLVFEGTTVSQVGDEPPHSDVRTYGGPGAFVNPPHIWGCSTYDFTGSKLQSNGGTITFTFKGSMKRATSGESATSLMDVLNAYIPQWPFCEDPGGDVDVTLQAVLARDGRLVSGSYNVAAPQYGCSMKFADILPTKLAIDGDEINIQFVMKEEEATAKTSGHTAWSSRSGPNFSSRFSMTSYVKTTGFSLTFSRSKPKK